MHSLTPNTRIFTLGSSTSGVFRGALEQALGRNVCSKTQMRPLILLSVWNFKDEVEKKNFQTREAKNGRLSTYLPIASSSHTHPSHSQTSRLLTSSLSLGVPVPRPTQCMGGAYIPLF
jgi:hypothetical protein